MDFVDEVQSGFVAGDGPIEAWLPHNRASEGHSVEALCLTDPDLVRDFHHQYIAAGARLIRTNTQAANAVGLAKSGAASRVNELNWSAAQLARECAKGKDVYVAGAIGPSGVTAEEASARGIERRTIFQEQMGALLDGGVHLILLEKFVDLDELLLALHVKQSLHHCPVICLLMGTLKLPSTDRPAGPPKTCGSPPLAPDGGGDAPGSAAPRLPVPTLPAPPLRPWAEAFSQLLANGADGVGLSCAADSLTMLDRLREGGSIMSPLCAFPDRTSTGKGTAAFVSAALALVEHGVRLLGGCCGVIPADIEAMVAAVKDRQFAG